MAGTRRIGNMRIHFVGDNATQLESMFGDAYSGSETFRNAMRETARTYRNIYVGSTLADLRGLPNFDQAGFNPESKDVTDKAAFGKPAGAETYFIGVTGREHTLKHSGQSFAGSSLLALVHEFLHPTQITRELAETGKLERTHEARTQMREQKIAAELGKIPGQDFPDVIGSGAPYDVELNSPGAQPGSSPQSDPAQPVDPIRYGGRARLNPGQPTPHQQASGTAALQQYDAANTRILGKRVIARDAEGNIGNWAFSAASIDPMNPIEAAPSSQTDGTSAIISSKPVRYLGRRIAGQSQASAFDTSTAAASDRQDSFSDRFGNWNSSPESITLRNPDLPVPESGKPLGIFSGKPMPEWPFPPPIWGLPDSKASGDSDGNWFTSLGGILDRTKSRASRAGGSGHSLPSPAPQIPQGSTPSPLLEYIQSLKRLDGSKSQASAIDSRAPAATPVFPDEGNFMGGLAGRIAALAGIDPQNPDQFAPPAGGVLGGFAGRLAALAGIDTQNPTQPAPSPQDDELRSFYRDDPTWFLQVRR